MITQTITWADRIANAATHLKTCTADELDALLTTKLGMDTTADLDNEAVFKFGDFREALKDKPIGHLRKAFAALRGGKPDGVTTDGEADSRTSELRHLGYKVTADTADTKILLEHYIADKPNDPVTVSLKKRFTDKPIIAFRDDGTVAVAETVQYAADLEQGFPAADTLLVDGKLVKLWPVGMKPDVEVDEDPLFPGQPLRNGCSIANNRNWSKVSHANRQLCRIIMTRGEIDVHNRDAVLRLVERAEQSALSAVFQEADLEFRDLGKKAKLPTLKVTLGAGTPKAATPFGVKRNY